MTPFCLLANFFTPEQIGTNPAQLLWLLPLAVAGVVVYKAIKLPQITIGFFLKEVISLFTFLICLLLLITLAIFVITALMT